MFYVSQVLELVRSVDTLWLGVDHRYQATRAHTCPSAAVRLYDGRAKAGASFWSIMSMAKFDEIVSPPAVTWIASVWVVGGVS